MKILIFDWASEAKPILEKLGREHKEEVEIFPVEIFPLIDQFLENGLSVMIEKPAYGGHDYVIFVDLSGKRFRQR